MIDYTRERLERHDVTKQDHDLVASSGVATFTKFGQIPLDTTVSNNLLWGFFFGERRGMASWEIRMTNDFDLQGGFQNSNRKGQDHCKMKFTDDMTQASKESLVDSEARLR